MEKIHKVTAQIRYPKGNDPGQVTFGYYIINNGVMQMTDSDGQPIRKSNGELWTRTLEPDENPNVMARVFTREIREQMQGSMNDWSRPLSDFDWPTNGGVV
jgi:hypothetical protein